MDSPHLLSHTHWDHELVRPRSRRLLVLENVQTGWVVEDEDENEDEDEWPGSWKVNLDPRHSVLPAISVDAAIFGRFCPLQK